MIKTNPNDIIGPFDQSHVPLEVYVHPLTNKGNLLGYASARLADSFIVCGIKIVSGENGITIHMPSVKDNCGNDYDICPASSAFRHRLNTAVLDGYAEVVRNPSVQQTLLGKH